MKIWLAPNSPCVRCGGDITSSTGNRMVCQQCKQVWTIGPENCWEAVFEENREALKDHLEELKEFARRVHD